MSVSGLREEVLSLYHVWRGCCGVLLFLYSVILTKVKEMARLSYGQRYLILIGNDEAGDVISATFVN